jgi:uncharacterized protein (TIGR02300 family)
LTRLKVHGMAQIRDRFQEGESRVSQAELGLKRTCPECGSKFYDLNKNPATCPKCGAGFDLSISQRQSRARQSEPPKPEPKQIKAKKPLGDEEFSDLEDQDVDLDDIDDLDDSDDEDDFEDDLDDENDLVGSIEKPSGDEEG